MFLGKLLCCGHFVLTLAPEYDRGISMLAIGDIIHCTVTSFVINKAQLDNPTCLPCSHNQVGASSFQLPAENGGNMAGSIETLGTAGGEITRVRKGAEKVL